ncbi:MAG: hypothetical protein LJE84_02725 [Gammaproteobacteria bacterium]|jgi:hypothetical protein|nr:hypothetical protein [Gammaproteobacteria bacterium]
MSMTTVLQTIAGYPWLRWPAYLLFAWVFYNAGETTTVWLAAPGEFSGGWAWLWVATFPLLLVAFFQVNRYLGCASGQCAAGARTKDRGDWSMPPGH